MSMSSRSDPIRWAFTVIASPSQDIFPEIRRLGDFPFGQAEHHPRQDELGGR